MKVVKWFSVLSVVVFLGIFPKQTYGQEMAKAPQGDEYDLELNDPKTIKELKNITEGEIEAVISGRSPVSIDNPRDPLSDEMRGVNNLKRGVKEETFRAPAILRPKSIILSQGI